MKAHTPEQFKTFMAQLLETNAKLDFYTDFNKITRNINHISIKLNQLNYLLGKENINEAIIDLWNENPKVFSVLDILIGIRAKDKKKAIDRDGKTVSIDSFFTSPERVFEYIEDTGLKKVFENKDITNLVDYVFGVETGLDTNARKNRSGKIMENIIHDILSKENIPHRKEVYSSEYEDLNCLGEDLKRFDFVIQTKVKTYLIEVNFYSGGGSKLNEVARSYSEIAPKINNTPTFEFVWITDGIGWNNAKNKLEEAFYKIPRIFNLTSIYEFTSEIKKEGF